MKQLSPALSIFGVIIAASPTFAQQVARQPAPPATPPVCDTLAVTRALAHPFTSPRHQVLAPRDSGAVRTRIVTRRVRLADGSVRVSKYATSGVHVAKGGVPVTKTQPVACTPAAVPVPASGTSVGDVPTAPVPVSAPGEVVPRLNPTVGSSLALPLLGGLLLGGTAVAFSAHHPGSPSATTRVDSLPTAPGGGGTGGGGTGGGGTGGGGTGGGGTGGGGTGGGGTGGGGAGGGGTGGGGTGGGGTGGGGGGTVVPEPVPVALTAAGLLLLTGYARRRRR